MPDKNPTPPAFAEEFKLPSGRTVQRLKLPGRVFFEFQSAIQKNGVTDATKWLMCRMYMLEGQPITVDTLEGDEDGGLDFVDAAELNIRASALFPSAQGLSK